MAGRWSSENVVAEYRELQANAMAVDCTGQYALLAGRRVLALVDLDKPTENVKKIPRQSKWEISAVQWNPHRSHAQLFATACNQRADIWNRSNSSCVQQGSLKAHTRVISDLDWSPKEPNVIGTCSVDTYTYIWDIRDYRKPSVSLQAVAGASQIKWNKVNSNLLATTHDGDIRIWDPRKGTSPVQYIAGHLSKIHGLDWCPISEFHLATSSQDCTVKFWDVTNPRQPENKLSSSSPVWRARYTPFGRGLMTVVVPQLRRGENSLLLWCISDLKQPVHTFVGHTDVVLEFQWRQIEEQGDFQLVTWSKDQSLRLWLIDSQLQKLCGQDRWGESASPGETIPLPESMTNLSESPEVPLPGDGGVPSTSLPASGLVETKGHIPVPPETPPTSSVFKHREEVNSPQQPKTLQQEFSLVNIDIPNVTVDEMNALERTFTVTAAIGKHEVQLTMTFPESYPNNVPPSFQFGKPLNINTSHQTKLIKMLMDTSLQHVKLNRSCIEPCLRQLAASLQSSTSKDRKSPDTDAPYNFQPSGVIKPPNFLPMHTFGTYHDVSIPFPRTSGARFSSTGYLVCFTRRPTSEGSRRASSNADPTPRALSALSAYSHTPSVRTPEGAPRIYNLFSMARSPPSDNSVSLTNFFYYKDRNKRPRSKSRAKETNEFRNRDSNSSPKKQVKTGPVIIYNISCVLAIHKQLAENYVIDSGNLADMCSHNANVAASVGRRDLVQLWSLAALSNSKLLKPDPDPDKAPWAVHPFGRSLLKSLVDHYSKLHDVQTLAMLCCAFGTKFIGSKAPSPPPKSPSSEKVTPQLNYNPYHTIHPSDTSLKGWNFTVAKIKRSSSWTEMYEGYRCGEETSDPAEVEKEKHEKSMRLLEKSQNRQHDQFKKAYADILYRWGLLSQRAEVLKYVSNPPEPHNGLEFNLMCAQCEQESRGPQCSKCKTPIFYCSICHIPVKGVSSFCLICGHGGHCQHMLDWFKTHSVCPTGCGCQCLQDGSGTVDRRDNVETNSSL